MTTVGRLNWMSGVDNGTKLHKLSILGTHESCALYGGGPTQCQSKSITELLEAGVRFLDVRCVHAHGTWDFPVFHGSVYQETHFADVERACRDFLHAHPSETILMNLQQEINNGLVNRTGEEFLERFLDLYDPSVWVFPNSSPKLEDCRGKIVLVRAYDPASKAGWPSTYPSVGKALPGGGGLEWNGFHTDGTSYNTLFETQNGWEIYGKGRSFDAANAVKEGKVEEYLKLAAAGKVSPNRFYINFLSRAAGAYVGTAAEKINGATRQFLRNHLADYSQRLGIVPIDFVGNTSVPNCLEDLVLRHNPYIAAVRFQY
ncbi:phosphatidylinositol-specific phospholipase C domain-containing protein [Kitasatospora sp. NPDC057500]|uniref:phosphatidylinositol-specific phospholipase C domain-containing protein n=1 Tax=Kitasatospora sp. NPDC057500 TaxID=3346151 RepID=UPI0036A7B330